MKNTLVFLLLVGIILILFCKMPERFQDNSSFTKFNGSVHIRGKLNIVGGSNSKINFDKLVIRDSATGLVGSIDSQKLGYLVNNKDHRLKLFCLGNTCIGKNHLDILKGKTSFKLRDLSENQCLSTTGNKYIHWRESTKFPQHDDNDDAKFQVLQNPITYNDCGNNSSNINFNIKPLENVRQKTTVNNQNSKTTNKGFTRDSENYIRSKRPSSNKVGVSV